MDNFFTWVAAKAAPAPAPAPVAAPAAPVSEAQRALNTLLRGVNPELRDELREIVTGLGFSDCKVGEFIPAAVWDGDLCIQFAEEFFRRNRRECYRIVAILKFSAMKAGFQRAFMDDGTNGAYLRIVQ